MTRFATIFAVTLLAVTNLGCPKQDSIEQYTVDHPKRESLRTLAAILPYKDKTWFFKLSGPAPAVEKQKEAFDTFLASIKLDPKGEPPVSWTAPAGWKEQGGGGNMRFASFAIEGPTPLEMTIVPLPGESGSELDNINRWRKQIHIAPVTRDDLDGLLKRKKIGDHELATVDMLGTGEYAAPRKAKAPPSHAFGQLGGGLPFQFKLPAGWREQSPPAPLSKASFHAGEGKEEVSITLSMFSGDGGGVDANVARWRSQVGLAGVTPAELRKEVQTMKVAGVDAHYVDLSNPKNDSPKARILGVVLPLQRETWFVKMTGPVAAVGTHKQAFEDFVKSFEVDSK